ncbi:endoribonuclease Dicer [Apostasia shenzhenica]|uniref:Endoribonuclease Dicer n=1 Tax=Apostasia shenzhenica TaxID=1088818 RepID=A0A2I0AUC0_9ASPA|nr:endoribonuclease Dicer [Apostasia shenzhenica]
MSTNALRDLNGPAVPELEKKNENSSKGNFIKVTLENNSEILGKFQNLSSSSVTLQNGSGVESNGEIGNVEVEYVETENLVDLLLVDETVNVTLLARLDSKDWVSVCEALNNVRQLSFYHMEKLTDMLGDLVSKIVKSLKNPRSAVCKTAIMTAADIFKVYNDRIIEFLDPMLVQLLLKSSQDKRFVCDASETALIAMTTWISPSLLLSKLLPYLKNKNPRIRAKASMCFSRSVSQLGDEGIKRYGIDKLIQIAASQLSDQLPESREAARTLVMELQTFYERSQSSSSEDLSLDSESTSWEAFCQSELSPLSAQAILRVTSTAKEGSVLGC